MHTEYSEEFFLRLGKLVVEFGRMERYIRFTIILMIEDDDLGKTIVPPSNMVSQNIELLKRICNQKIKPTALKNWESTIKSLESLFEERNKIFHGTFYSLNNNPITLARHKKSKRPKPDTVITHEYSLDKLDEIYNNLYAHSRQLLDFSDDYFDSKELKKLSNPSQKIHPQLTHS